ncbi:hypothetical protein BGZ60DRAFT_420365 [Tricladium varicosporioides]|nr:hypothetical protein BGZ60DRAFT_420365 [Hymenoscyphus varicosporioides]
MARLCHRKLWTSYHSAQMRSFITVFVCLLFPFRFYELSCLNYLYFFGPPHLFFFSSGVS